MQSHCGSLLLAFNLLFASLCSHGLNAQSPPTPGLAKAVDLHKLAMGLASQQKYDEAAVEMAKVLMITRDTLGKDDGAVAGRCLDLAKLLDKAGRFNEAVGYYRESLKLNLDFFGPNHQGIAETRRMFGVCLTNAGISQQAKSELKQAVDVAARVYGKDSVTYPRFLNDLGYCLVRFGDLNAGEAIFRECLTVRSKLPDCTPLELATTYNNLGDVLTKRSDYANARTQFDRAIEILRSTADNTSKLLVANLYNNVGFIYRKQGALDDAITWYDKALVEYLAILPADHPSVAGVRLNRGTCLLMQNKFKESLQDLIQSLASFSSANGPNHRSVASTMNVISWLQFKAGMYSDAAETAKRVVAVRSRALGKDHPDTLFSVYDVGLAELYLGNTNEAERFFVEAERGLKFILDNFSSEVATVHFGVGAFFDSQNRVESALERFDMGQKAIAKHMALVLPGLPQSEQNSHFNTISLSVNQSLAFALAHPDRQEVVNASFEWLANHKGIVEQSVGRQYKVLNLASTDNALANRLIQVRQHISSLALTKVTLEARQERREELELLASEESGLSRKMASESGIRASGESWKTLSQIQRDLPNDAILIDFARVTPSRFDAIKLKYLVGTDRYAAWVVPSSGKGSVRLIDLGPAETIDEMIGQIRKRIQSDGVEKGSIATDGESLITIALNTSIRKLRNLIWSPIELHIGDPKKVLFCPDSNLWLVPWSAIPLDNSEKVLIEKYTLQFVVNSRAIGRTQQSNVDLSKSVVFANPNFDIDGKAKLASISAIFENPLKADSDVIRHREGMTVLGKCLPLPATENEAEAIATSIELARAKRPRLYLRDSALECVVKRLNSPNVAVFATHGFFLPSQKNGARSNPLSLDDGNHFGATDVEGLAIDNPLLRCGLMLAGCNQPEAAVLGDDGVLTGIEIACLNLRSTAIVLLSACDTGVGDTRSGQSIAGVRQAFQLAGAESVVASLWKVPDRDTSFIMPSFFENLAAGQSVSEAIRNAQLKTIKYRRDTYGAAHPLFWAAWTVTE